jgi:hypothetical protein
VRCAERAVTAAAEPWHTHTAGLAYYRAGQFEKARASIRRSMARKDPWLADVCNWLALAMTEMRLGHEAEARNWLNKSCLWIDKAERSLIVWYLPLQKDQRHPHDWLAWLLLRQEAEELIYGKKS